MFVYEYDYITCFIRLHTVRQSPFLLLSLRWPTLIVYCISISHFQLHFGLQSVFPPLSQNTEVISLIMACGVHIVPGLTPDQTLEDLAIPLYWGYVHLYLGEDLRSCPNHCLTLTASQLLCERGAGCVCECVCVR